MAGRRPSRIAHSLVALGSAAVLTVYSAGYLRTRAAAQRFADEADRQRPVVPAPPPVPVLHPAVPLAPVTTTVRADALVPGPPPEAAPVAPKPAVPATRRETPAGTKAATSAPKAVAAKAARKPAAPKPVVDTAPVQPKPAEPTPAPAPVQAEPTPPPAPEPPPPAPASPYKDGTYTGWGTSRHGDIQATVVIEAGRIASATISRCLTRYSCSWIAILPPQVVSRQSPEVDYVSGATQSTNAFYYAVVDALAKAK
jgi:uncharacterized protein with FMN-binding domain